eukprot:2983929-Amphidinium_carterae.1
MAILLHPSHQHRGPKKQRSVLQTSLKQRQDDSIVVEKPMNECLLMPCMQEEDSVAEVGSVASADAAVESPGEVCGELPLLLGSTYALESP